MKAISKKELMQKSLLMSQMQMPLCLELIIQRMENGQGLQSQTIFVENKRG